MQSFDTMLTGAVGSVVMLNCEVRRIATRTLIVITYYLTSCAL